MATAVVSNFDTRLRPLLGLLGLGHLFDEIVVRCALASLFIQSTQVRELVCLMLDCMSGVTPLRPYILVAWLMWALPLQRGGRRREAQPCDI